METHKDFDTWMHDNAKNLVAAVGVLTAAVINLLPAMNVVSWSGGQLALALAEAGAVIAFLTAVILHFWPTTGKEPVAVAASFTALVTATITLGTGFVWWHISEAQESAILAVVAAVVGLATALLARHTVKPVPSPPRS